MEGGWRWVWILMESDGIGVNNRIWVRIGRKGVWLVFTIVLLIGCYVMDLDKESRYVILGKLGAGYKKK